MFSWSNCVAQLLPPQGYVELCIDESIVVLQAMQAIQMARIYHHKNTGMILAHLQVELWLVNCINHCSNSYVQEWAYISQQLE